MSDPVDNVVWVDAVTLEANNYNPNVVFTAELKLLEWSITQTGWVQPIIVSRDGIIVDGFHRWTLAQQSAALFKKYDRHVPVVVLDVDRATAMLMTVRMNRAKGTHVAVRMAEMVQELVDVHGLSFATVAKEIGGTVAEAEILHQNSLFKTRNLADAPYSRAWVPREGRIHGESTLVTEDE